MTLARLLSPCLLGHGQRIQTRIDGALSYQCERCHESLGPVLASEMIATRLSQHVPGAATGKAQIVQTHWWSRVKRA